MLRLWASYTGAGTQGSDSATSPRVCISREKLGWRERAAGGGGGPGGDYVWSTKLLTNIDIQGVNIGKNHGVLEMSD